MAKTQRVASFLLALFLIITSVGAVLLVIKQSKDADKASQTAQQATQNQPTKKECTVPNNLKSVPPSNPGEPPKITTPPTELQITDIKVGTGETAQLNDCITVNYRLFLADGTPVAGNDTFSTGQPIAFNLVEGGLIEGWIKGIPGMKVGGIRRLVVPPSLAYGDKAQNGIPANSTLVFDVELLDTKH